LQATNGNLTIVIRYVKNAGIAVAHCKCVKGHVS